MSEKRSVRIKRMRAELDELKAKRDVAESKMKKHRDVYFALRDPICNLGFELDELVREKKHKAQEKRAAKKLLAVYTDAPEFKSVRDTMEEFNLKFSATAKDNDDDGVPDAYTLTFTRGNVSVCAKIVFDRIKREKWDCEMELKSSWGTGLPLYHLSVAHQDAWRRIVEHISFPLDTTVRMSEFVVALVVQAFPWWADYCDFDFETYTGADGVQYYCAGGGNLPVAVYPNLLADKK